MTIAAASAPMIGASEPKPSGGVGARMASSVRRVVGSPRLLVGVLIVTFFALVAIVGPFFVSGANNFVGPELVGPSARYWLGTTETGQNVFAQLVVSTRASVEVGLFAGLIATVTSIVIGIGGGFLGGVTDELLALFTNVILVIPALPLVIIISAYVKSSGLDATILVIAFTSWAASARVLRSQTLSVRSRDYVLAARVSGERTWRIVVVEILPNELAIIVSQLVFAIIFAILTQAGLAFLGLESPNLLTWGNMLYYAQNDEALSSGAWWWFVPPGLCIAVLGAGLALVNFGMDEILNPRLRVYRPPKGHSRS